MSCELAYLESGTEVSCIELGYRREFMCAGCRAISSKRPLNRPDAVQNRTCHRHPGNEFNCCANCLAEAVMAKKVAEEHAEKAEKANNFENIVEVARVNLRVGRAVGHRHGLMAAAEAQCVGCESNPPDLGDPANHVPPRHGSLVCNSTRIWKLIEALDAGREGA